MNNSFSLWKDNFAGVPPILGLLLFNKYVNYIFIFADSTLYLIGENHNINRNILNKKFLSLQKWLYDSYMVLNPGKCCYTSFGSKFTSVI